MSGSGHTVEKHGDDPRARESGRWIRGKNGGGWLKLIEKGDRSRAGYRKPGHLIETLRLAREASPVAVAVLIKNLDNPDGKIAVTAANLLLERAWGRVIRETNVEEGEQPQLNWRDLTDAELEVVLRVLKLNRLLPTAEDGSAYASQVIEGQRAEP
jgi:hypothetical protein